MNETLKFSILSLFFFESSSAFRLWNKTSNSISLKLFPWNTLNSFVLCEFWNPLLCKTVSSTLKNFISETMILHFQSFLVHMNHQVQLTKKNPNQLIQIKRPFQLVSKILVFLLKVTLKKVWKLLSLQLKLKNNLWWLLDLMIKENLFRCKARCLIFHKIILLYKK